MSTPANWTISQDSSNSVILSLDGQSAFIILPASGADEFTKQEFGLIDTMVKLLNAHTRLR